MVSEEKIKEEAERDLADCVLNQTYFCTVGEMWIIELKCLV